VRGLNDLPAFCLDFRLVAAWYEHLGLLSVFEPAVHMFEDVNHKDDRVLAE
jgi:hypothetical protein